MDDMGNVLTESSMSGLFESVTEVSKATAYKVDVTFDRRLRIWTDQVLPGREHEIHTENSVEFVYRVLDLLFADADRLTNRAIKEGSGNNAKMMSRIGIINEIVEKMVKIYMKESDRIKLNRKSD